MIEALVLLDALGSLVFLLLLALGHLGGGARRRIAARGLDAMLFTFLGVFAWVLLLSWAGVPDHVIHHRALLQLVGPTVMMPFDALFTVLWGQTPGKALLGLQVVSADRRPITWSRAWERAVLVWTNGFVLGIPALRLLTWWSAVDRIGTTGRASWDETTGTEVVMVGSRRAEVASS